MTYEEARLRLRALARKHDPDEELFQQATLRFAEAIKGHDLAEQRRQEKQRVQAAIDQRIIEETWHFIMQMNIKDQRPHRHLVLRFITERAPIHSVTRIYEMMLTAHWIKEHTEKGEITVQALPEPNGDPQC